MKSLARISKFISLVLRHQPEKIDLLLDENGWADAQELISKMNKNGIEIDELLLEQLVADNDKQRFAFNEDHTKIRASQGHSISINLLLPPAIPPAVLYHGTAIKNLESILKNGLQKQNRQHVHLSATMNTATAVGSRHGKPVVLVVNTLAMQQDGYLFYLSENKVWLTEHVPPQYLSQ